jgi:hypothetical protein
MAAGAGLRSDCADLLNCLGCFAGVGTDSAGIAQLGTALLQQETHIRGVLLDERRCDLKTHDSVLSGSNRNKLPRQVCTATNFSFDLPS